MCRATTHRTCGHKQKGSAPSLCLSPPAALGLTSSMQQAEGLSSLRILPRRGYPWWGGNGVVAGGTRRARRRPMNIQCRRLPEKHLPINYRSCGTSPSLHRAEMRVIPLAPSPWPPAPHQPLRNERRLAAIPEGIDGCGGHRGLCPVINSQFNYTVRGSKGADMGWSPASLRSLPLSLPHSEKL